MNFSKNMCYSREKLSFIFIRVFVRWLVPHSGQLKCCCLQIGLLFYLHKLVFPVFPISRFDEWPPNAVRTISGIASNLFGFVM